MYCTSVNMALVVVLFGQDVDDGSTVTVGSHFADGTHVVEEAFRGRQDQAFACQGGLLDRRE